MYVLSGRDIVRQREGKRHTTTKIMFSDQIDKHTLEIAQADEQTYSNLQELGDELPGHSPRFVLLSYPTTLVLAFCT